MAHKVFSDACFCKFNYLQIYKLGLVNLHIQARFGKFTCAISCSVDNRKNEINLKKIKKSINVIKSINFQLLQIDLSCATKILEPFKLIAINMF